MRSIFLIQEEWRHENMSKEFDKQSRHLINSNWQVKWTGVRGL